ncbi:UvrD-helicase domain-containing protein [Ralstonia pseudosolanacearum]|uniref:UvrD-helicase domain-containing protein n=1 Tax=Ralstonia pseudosolanacearum TaxID=1310165 RepID=UPI003CF78ECE
MSKATSEQLRVVLSTVHRLIVQACSGAGKTFTLEEYSLANPGARILYLAYNKAIRDEAAGKFPTNVDCRTTHSLAWHFGRRFKDAGKLGNLRPNDLMKAFDVKVGFARVLLTTVENFLYSDDADFVEDHVPQTVAAKDVATVAEWGRIVWATMRDLERKDVPMPHDGYLKLYQLSKPDLSRNYDIILFDEAQDANPVTTAIVEAQSCRLVIVGDKYQSIYAFRGAVNAMERIKADETLYLTESRRFGPGIAKLATLLLKTFRDEEHPVRSAFPDRETRYVVDRNLPYAIIGRTNAKLFGKAVALLGRKRMHFVGGIENYPFDKLVDVWHLMNNEPGLVQDSMFKTFGSLAKLEDYASKADDKEILSLIGVVKEYRGKVTGLVERIKAEAVENQEDADVSLTTAHRSKGLEFDQVVLLDDFEDFITDSGEFLVLDTPELVQELHLLYVAITRAMNVLELNVQMRHIVEALAVCDVDAKSLLSEGITEQGGEEVGQLAGFDYTPRTHTRDVSETRLTEQGALVAGEQDRAGAGADIESMVELAILRQGLLQVARLAQELRVERGAMADIIVSMIRKGRLAEVLFVGSPEIAARLRVETV